MAIPPAAAVPAIPTKCPLPMLLANREAPICKEKKQKLVLMFKGTAEKCPSFGTLSSLWWCCCWQWLTINSSIDFRTLTETRAPSITSTVLRENRMVNQISSSWVKKYITPIQILNVCKTSQTGIGVISRQSGKKIVISLVQGGDEQGTPAVIAALPVPHCTACDPNVPLLRAGLGSL